MTEFINTLATETLTQLRRFARRMLDVENFDALPEAEQRVVFDLWREERQKDARPAPFTLVERGGVLERK